METIVRKFPARRKTIRASSQNTQPVLADTVPLVFDPLQPGRPAIFPDSILDAVLFNRHQTGSILLRPCLSCLHLTQEECLGDGTGFTVYRADSEKRKKVVKIERVILQKDEEADTWSVHYPWVGLGLGQERTGLYSIQDAQKRRQIHLETKLRLENVGIATAEYIGSIVVPSMPLEGSEQPVFPNGTGISPVGEPQYETEMTPETAALRAEYLMQQSRATGQLPLYAEVWENPGGSIFGKDEMLVEKTYQSPEGRALLRRLAQSLIDLSKQGFLFDVDCVENKMATVAKTEKGYPYPRNFFIVNGDISEKTKLVAIDFNLGVDLTKGPWWRIEFQQAEPVIRERDGILYGNWELIGAMEKTVNTRYQRTNGEEAQRSGNHNQKNGNRNTQEHAILTAQVEHFSGQLQVAASILAKIEEMEK
ncbi:MAG: hypothetical protein V1922_06125 [bacterium]